MRTSPARGPSAIATATARLSSTTGVGTSRDQRVVEPDDGAPVGLVGTPGPGVTGRDRGLEQVRSGAHAADRESRGEGPVDERQPFRDLDAIPATAILVLEQRQRAVRTDTGVAARVLEQEQGEEPNGLGLLGHELRHQPRQPDRLGTQLAADQRVACRGAVPLVEDQVEDREHAVEPLGQELVGRHPVRDPGVAYLLLGPDQSLGERGLGNQEGTRDLGRGEAAERSQGERDAGVHRESRMAAGEHQAKPIVAEAAVAPEAHVVLLSSAVDEGALDLGELQGLATCPADPVEGAVSRRGGDPCPWVARNAIPRPGLERGHERVGERLLGQVEVAQDADERREDPTGLVTEGPLDVLADRVGGQPAAPAPATSESPMSRIGRTSTEPYAAPGQRPAASSAASRFGHSTM